MRKSLKTLRRAK